MRKYTLIIALISTLGLCQTAHADWKGLVRHFIKAIDRTDGVIRIGKAAGDEIQEHKNKSKEEAEAEKRERDEREQRRHCRQCRFEPNQKPDMPPAAVETNMTEHQSDNPSQITP